MKTGLNVNIQNIHYINLRQSGSYWHSEKIRPEGAKGADGEKGERERGEAGRRKPMSLLSV